MTVEEVAQALAERTAGRGNPLPLVRRGARVSVHFHGLAANGTVLSSWGTVGNAISRIRLDETEQIVEVTWNLLHPELKEIG